MSEIKSQISFPLEYFFYFAQVEKEIEEIIAIKKRYLNINLNEIKKVFHENEINDSLFAYPLELFSTLLSACQLIRMHPYLFEQGKPEPFERKQNIQEFIFEPIEFSKEDDPRMYYLDVIAHFSFSHCFQPVSGIYVSFDNECFDALNRLISVYDSFLSRERLIKALIAGNPIQR